MSKKKRSQRKPNLHYARQATEARPTTNPVDRPAHQPEVIEASQDHLKKDLRMIGILAGSCVALEVILWLLLQHSAIGQLIFGH